VLKRDVKPQLTNFSLNFFSVHFTAAQILTATLLRLPLQTYMSYTYLYSATTAAVVQLRIHDPNMKLCFTKHWCSAYYFISFLCAANKFHVVLCPIAPDPGDATDNRSRRLSSLLATFFLVSRPVSFHSCGWEYSTTTSTAVQSSLRR